MSHVWRARVTAWCLCCLLWLAAPAAAWWDESMDECPPVPPVTTWYGEIRDRLARDYPDRALDPLIVVRIGEQRLYLIRHGVPFLDYPVSTSRYGIGNRDGSLKTPLGVHQVRRRIGEDAPLGTIFRGRANTGRIANILTTPETSPEDNITSRILWLDGLEEGVNRGGEVDSFQRFIYIHGTDEEGLIGQPASDGCVRMTNAAVIELFDQVPLGTLVVIVE
ncbi:ErfK/YbiS/YcfS/YnhG family protein [Thioalkalivibrio sulfidiphilus HL-EbGr7]|uniref:ErfK/YbiS/YcfS/YnhG family protein n=2 Tax=Thioalkalivibrio TaxID=106633 RepID=B8GQF1_THISH|nr:ErfK/YbiS/YcfS/YnhG family protein [Thioalkalivibrio sulfidiphilus HL-EbGr7]